MNSDQLFDDKVTGQPIFTVSELSSSLKRSVEASYSGIRVRGEISGLKRHTSGHIYYALKDDNAVIDAVSWRGTYSQNVVALEDGLEIVAYGRLTTYPQRSKYQFIVESYEATGQGALLKLLEERKQKLEREGLFDRAKKKPIPLFPKIIGVVTSPTGAVIRDILHRIQDRFPCQVIVWPVLVQGPGAAEQIAMAIEGFQNLTPRPDTLIVARGGGSLEDLWAFNEEVVVRAAANSTIPLISAVGHETDTTLIDYAADLRAPTPTGAAELAVPVLSDLWRYLQDRIKRLTDTAYAYLDNQQLRLKVLERSLPNPLNLIEDKRLRLDDWQDRLVRALINSHRQAKERLLYLSTRLRAPKELLQNLEQQKETRGHLLALHFARLLDDQTNRFSELALRLEQASFHKILERGFALVTGEDNHPIASVKQFPDAKPVKLTLQDGTLSVMKVSGKLPSRKEPPAKTEQPKLF
ncbi:exodeoxyribonuclease VII large subunit [Candidatus Paracaedibacter symbiosus]|uniref:exodeoxyribonuclease VII large subunit n=1 Tax=Candidatus Paracaedibacter symbiosus TaxID=244582 RepID=UPI0006893CDD|nr:exodeoxyribonuclease VII large subunit [Candidatus Paracaedibacter symbiosus]